MSFFVHSNGVIAPAGRRALLGQSARLLSGAAVALLAGRGSLAAETNDAAGQDVRILNTALGAELEAIAAYQLGADSGLLQKPVRDLALAFQGHHKEHADVLAKTVAKLGGKAVTAKAKYTFPTETLKTQADVLRFAAALEKGAVSAYLGAVPVFGNRDLAKAAASILGDEAMHWAILRSAVGEVAVPAAFVS
ncbi:MAG: ferritin-like domain-containing protein [Burkholderiaceae bacterium]|nr:ferritin-like domain-containing protein [Burkholderiaceae bacterium]HMN66825.1 ferritin-like domain-containing protein [Burkholderiaceae bacterium]